MRQYLFILILASLSASSKLVAQVYPFVNYTPRDGLVSNKVRFINQDSKGRLYFGTTNGLSVYDGSRFVNYSAENGLFSSQVNGITEVNPDSILIIENSHKLQYLSEGKIKDVHLRDSFCPVINQFIRCKNNTDYAIADEGLFLFEKNHFQKIVFNNTGDSDRYKNLSWATELDSVLLINTDVLNPAYRTPKAFIV